jgi:DNA segregation ATPase FtsK/SpoIIIE, S-DNA-T family
MAEPREHLVVGVRTDLGRARAAARAQLAEAQERLRAAAARLAAARRSAQRVPDQAAAARDVRLAEAAQAHAAAIAQATRLAAEAARQYAPGAASAPWSAFRPAPVPRAQAPGPLRIGEVRLPGGTPVPVLVPLLDRAHLAVTGTGRGADGVIAALLLRALAGTDPGRVVLAGYDPEQLGGGLAGFAPLAGRQLLTFVGPGGLTGLLDNLVDHIRRINETVLAGSYASLREMAAATGRRPEPWRIAVLLGDEEPTRHERAQLERILRTGVACGVHLVVRGIPVPEASTMEVVRLDGPHATVRGYGSLRVHLDPPPAELVSEVCRDIAERVASGPAPAAFADLLPAQWWTESSAAGLTAPVGEGLDGRLVTVTLGDYPPHALIGGPSGTGKTNLIYAWLAGLTTRYSPDELELYLLDFKEGVSFARFAPGHVDRTWLPHVRLVGVNVNTDREFGLALLRFLGGALRERAAAAKRHEVSTLAELRAADPDGRWPRIVAVVDEFQVLLSGRDGLTAEAVTLLEDLARRGRSQGIHLVLASQDVSGIEALWGRGGLIAQFTLRVALPKARRILPDTNPAAQEIARHQAVVNADSGAPGANQVVRVPAASDRPMWSELQQALWRRRTPGTLPPRLFDGDAVPRLEEAPELDALHPGADDPVALLGAAIDVAARSARIRLRRSPGRNLAVLGTRVEEACAVLAAAATSLARQYPPGEAAFAIACLDPDAEPAARELAAALPLHAETVEPDALGDLLELSTVELGRRTRFLVLYAVDAAGTRLGAKGREQLRRILHNGPEQRTHVLGWWRSVARLREDLGGIGARLDCIGAWVALDVHGGDLAPLYPQPGGPAWYPRPWRALVFDRSEQRSAEVMIPYA